MTTQEKQQKIEALRQMIAMAEANRVNADDLRCQLAELETDGEASPIGI